MPSASRLSDKEKYDAKLCSMLDDYDRAFLVHADNVGSKQFMDIRRGLRPNSAVLMGKNTMMKRCIRLYNERTGSDAWAPLLDALVGNVGLVFTKGDLNETRDEIKKYVVGAPARVGLVAPVDVNVPAGNTGLDPSQTNFFQALSIPTKINRGTVEIVSDVKLITAGDKVGASEAMLLSKLGIKPFEYGLVIRQVIEGGSIFDPKILDIKDDDLLSHVTSAITQIAAVSLQLGYPTLASIPHSVINGYKNVLAVAVETDYSFDLADKVKAYLADPSAFASAAPAEDTSAPAAADAKPADAKPAEESEEESDEDMGMGLFG